MSKNNKKVIIQPDKEKQIIDNLMNSELDTNEYIKTIEIGQLLPDFLYNNFLKEAEIRAEKYILKKKPKLTYKENGEINLQMREATKRKRIKIELFRLCLDYLIKKIFGNSNEPFKELINYMNFSKHISKEIKKKDISNWTEIIKKSIKEWKEKYKLDEKVLKAIALITAKLTFRFYYVV